MGFFDKVFGGKNKATIKGFVFEAFRERYGCAVICLRSENK